VKLNKKITLSALLVLAVFLFFGGLNIFRSNRLIKDKNIGVLIVYKQASLASYPGVLPAYESVLKEEGVYYKKLEATLLVTLPPEEMARTNNVVIFPDCIIQEMPKETALWVLKYMEAGGSIMVVYDAGVKDWRGNYIDRSVFAQVCGVNYATYGKLRGKAYAAGNLRFVNRQAAEYLEIPDGKYNKEGLVTGYLYGPLNYPVARTENIDLKREELIAESVLPDGSTEPGLVLRTFSKGNIFYANIPLGYLKAYGDDLLLRECLRTFLFKKVQLPHLVNAPYGKGGLVINWHTDASPDWEGVLNAEKNGMLRKDIKYSIHITAGDFRDEPGDGIGFDAEGKGRKIYELLKNFGAIGCHGGWAHNWFAANISNKTFGKNEIAFYLKKNKDSLEKSLDYKITEYSAPEGVHPQPVMTEALEAQGFTSYYYDGDMGAPPNRTFFDGKMISDKVIAFPIMCHDKYASLFEMSEAGITPGEVGDWLNNLLVYIEKNRTVRLFYSHFRDLYSYEEVFGNFLDNIEKLQKEDRIMVQPMSYFADFTLRYLKTDFSYERENGKLLVRLKNPEGLAGITVAVPTANTEIPDYRGFSMKEKGEYYYFTVTGNNHEETLTINNISFTAH